MNGRRAVARRAMRGAAGRMGARIGGSRGGEKRRRVHANAWDIGHAEESVRRAYNDAAEWVGKTVESMRFENWAPRSSRAWRLREYKSESDASQYRGGGDEAGASAAEEAAGGEAVALLEKSLRDVEISKLALQCEDYEDGMECALEMDEDVEDPMVSFSATVDERYMQELLAAPPLTGKELADLVYAKYGKYHDMVR